MNSRYVAPAIVVVAMTIMIAAVLLTGRESVPHRLAVRMALPPPPPLPKAVADLASLRLLSGHTDSSLDSIAAVPGGDNIVRRPLPARESISVRRDQMLAIVGWAIDIREADAARAVFLEMDERSLFPARYGDDRPDVASYYNNPALLASGFSVSIRASQLSRGAHHFDVIIIAADGLGYYRMADQIVCTRL